jgi:hypothetical protein
MSIPLDNLYHWVDSLMPGPANLYVFRPHGSKKISDLSWLNDYDKKISYKFPSIIMHDQEPLDWDFYDCPDQYMELFLLKKWEISAVNNLRINYFSTFNLKFLTLLNGVIYDQDILIHSEKNSKDLVEYQQNGFVTVHYWAHAVIARDWYRFAQHDTRLNSSNLCKNKFLIYCRDWSHRREYRLKFLELLMQNNLDQVSQTSVMHVNGENVHFSQHQFCNSKFNLDNLESISSISSNAFSSSASADYNPEDFVKSEISVVLETVFDDSRVHLTEKTLRPIACGHPFILAAGPGALEYIRSYGFKTFAPWIDESYDLETDSLKRLEKIINAMVKIQNLQGSELEEFSQGIKDIANFNKKHFFSNEFFNTVKNELQHNLQVAYEQVKKTKGKHYLEILKTVKKHELLHLFQLRHERTQLIRQLRQSSRVGQSNPQIDPSV